MKRPFMFLLGVALACGPAAEGAPPEEGPVEMPQVPEGYEQLLKSYNGRYHKGGWNHYGPGYFELDSETGVLTSHGGMGLFWYSVKEFSDFVLELEFKSASAETNSGVFVRVPGMPVSDDYIYHSFEIQISDAGEGIHQTGAAYDAEAPTHLASNPPGEWNHSKITFVGGRLSVELNGGPLPGCQMGRTPISPCVLVRAACGDERAGRSPEVLIRARRT